MASSADFFENCRKVSRSSTCTITAFALSASFRSAAFAYLESINNDHSYKRLKKSDLLSTKHLGVRSLGVLQENFMNGGCCLQLAECLYAVEDTLMRVLVDRYRDELGLSYADDGGHNQHCLVSKL